MYRVLFQSFWIFNFLILHRVLGDDVRLTNDRYGHPYNIQELYRLYHDTRSIKDEAPNFANYLLLNPPDKKFDPEILESLLGTSKCSRDIAYTFESLTNLSNPWALRMLDSFAKPPESGILLGNFHWVGEYNECIKVYAPPKAPNSTTGNFHGQYCSLAFNLPLLNRSVPLKFAVCLPDSCVPQDLQDEILALLFKAGGFPVFDNTSLLENVTTTCNPRERHFTTAAISVIVLLSIFSALAFVGSAITVVKYFKNLFQERQGSTPVINISEQMYVMTDQDGVSKKSVESGDTSMLQNDASSSNGFLDNCEAILNCFCVFTNGAKLLNTDSSEGQLLCIHGIRFLSMTWVILGHTYAFSFLQTRNLADYIEVLDDFAFQAILQAMFSVDSFFVLSGFLLSYLAMKEFSKSEGSMNWIYFYVHRYIRLTPIYMVVLGFSASVFFYLGSGPYWSVVDYDPGCSKTWWWNLLYINNFEKQAEQCMGWTWYLANDMQFFVISPIFLIALWRWPKIGYSLLSLFLFACILSNFLITYHFDLMTGPASLGGKVSLTDTTEITVKFADYSAKIYVKPYTRIGPYLIGIIAGYILFKHKTENRPKFSWPYLCTGWIVASAVTLTCVYGLYHAHPSVVANSFYNAFSHICFGCGLSWVIYVCLTNQSYIVNSILSCKLFIPLSRLTYAAYLIHPLIITGYYASLKTPFEFTHPTMVCLYLSFIVVAYALALPVSLILESPIVSLEKLIRNKFNKV